MILVDTSVWIELLNGRLARGLHPDDLLHFATCSPILQEVLQGLRRHPASMAERDALLALPRLSDPLAWDRFAEASDIYRNGRRRGLTIRSSFDCLIAAVAIHHRVPVWHRDRDFLAIASFPGHEAIERFPESSIH